MQPRLAALACAAAVLAACEKPPGESAAAPATSSVPSQRQTPPAGSVRLRVSDTGVTLHASSAPRRDLLETLARELGFELQAGDVGNEPVSAHADAAPLEVVLPQLLPDRSYRLDYRLDAASRTHRVARLEIAQRAAELPEPTLPIDPADPAEPEPGTELAERTREAPEDAGDVDWKSLLLRLDDADAEERIEALLEIDPGGEGLTLIADRLSRDPDPRVRAVAATKLEMSETLAAVDALVLALGDPDRRVVLAAIDALEFTDDVTVVNDLSPLLQHPDTEIREAAFDAIDFILADD